MLFVPASMPAEAQSVPYYGASVTFDKAVYTWTDFVLITVVAPDFNTSKYSKQYIGNTADSRITITSTNGSYLDFYKLEETAADTGVFFGGIILTGSSTPLYYYDKSPVAPTGVTGGYGPWGGWLSTEGSDTIIVKFSETSSGSVNTDTTTAVVSWEFPYIEWQSNSVNPGEGVIVTVEDQDMNLSPFTRDSLQVHVYSDSNLSGAQLVLTEKEKFLADETSSVIQDSGIFEGQIIFTDCSPHDQRNDICTPHPSAKVFAKPGDTITAEYNDYTLPGPDYTATDSLIFTATTTVGTTDGFVNAEDIYIPPVSILTVQAQDSEIPAWIKNNAGWWATDLIDDSSFLQGIQYLIKEGIMVIPPTETSGSSGSQDVPAWIKNNAGWWADGQIDDNAFISGIQYLIKSGIIVVKQEQTPNTVTTTGLVEISDKEIQKLADEYWDCFMGERVRPGCVAWDEDKHAIGIEEYTTISQYWVGDSERGGVNSCDTDCSLSLHKHSDVSNKLEKFQDENLHEQLFDIFVSIAPKQILDEVVYLVISTDGDVGKVTAAVSRDPGYPLKFLLRIDPLDMAPSAGPINIPAMKVVMIHESAHILSMSSSQGDNDMVTGSVGIEPYTEFRELFQEKESACAPNYFAAVAGCMKDNSYLNLFFQEFWVDIYPSFKWFFEFDDYDKFLDHNALFHQKYKKQFVTDYAATNPDEDFAESYMLFVLKEKPTKPTAVSIWPTIADQKILFFYDFPELVEMRDFIRSNL